MKFANRATTVKVALCSSVSLFLMATTPALAGPLALSGDYIKIGLNDSGTLGYGGNTSPGILFDGGGTGTFNPSYDYLTPGSPFEGFTINGAKSGSVFSYVNNNDGTVSISGGSLTNYSGVEYNGSIYDQRAVWSATVSNVLSITNDYYFNKSDQQIHITTSIKAIGDLTGLSFSRVLDPDAMAAPGDSSDTNNYRGNGTVPESDLVYAEALASKYVIGLYTNTTFQHNSAVTDWTTDTASYLNGTNVGHGDNTIGLGFLLGDLLSGSSLSFNYAYIFGTNIAAAIGGANITGSSSASDLISGSVLPVLDGGTLVIDAPVSVANDIAITTSNGTIDTAGNSAMLTGVISGDGGLTKTGDGTLVLTGANSYTGGTTIAGGTLVGNTTSIQGNVVNNAALILDQNSDGTFGGVISGTGSLTKDGTGTVVLTGANSYTGGTTIAGGTLVGNTASLQGNVANAGTLVFAQAANGTFAGAVSGSGALVKTGTGTLVLTGANSFTGGTTITGGTLVGNSASIQGNVVNGGSLVFDQASDGVYAGRIGGSGGFVKQGAGSLNLTGASDYNGATSVNEGRLAVNGSLANSIITVGSNGTIGGNGTVGGLIVRNGGTAAPGNSIGHLTVAGNLTFEKGSTYAVEINAGGSTDQISTSGVAKIDGGTVKVLAEAGDYKPQTSYVILSAAGGVRGKFDNVTSNLAFLVPTLGYGTDRVTLTMTRNDVTFAQAGRTANQTAVGGAIDGRFLIGSAIYDALVGSSREQIAAGLDSLSGEIHASALSAAADDGSRLRRTLLDRAQSAVASSNSDRKVALWSQVGGNWASKDGNGNAANVDTSGYQLIAGIEFNPTENVKIGAAGGTAHSDVTVKRRGSSADIDTVFGAAYASVAFGAATIRGGASYSDLDIATHRTVDYRSLHDELRASYGGSLTQAFGEIGYTMPLGKGSVEPFAGFSGMWLKNTTFTETGASAALKGNDDNRAYGWTSLGLRATIGDARSRVVGRARIAWEHATSDVGVNSHMTFGTGGGFTVEGAPLSKDNASVEAGLEWRATSALSFNAGYTGVISNRGEDHGVRATAAIRF